MTSYNKKLKVVIPARGGSKGVHRKNLKLLNGIPLIAYPIMAAKECKHISDIYVSTEDKEISQVASGYGAKIIDRPEKYATDTSLDIDVMRHVVDFLSDDSDIVHLRATTPLIKAEVVDSAIEFFLNNPSCTALRSAHEASETAYKSFKKSGPYWQGLFDKEFAGDYYNLPRQLLPKTYQANGYIDIVRPSVFMKSNSLHGHRMLAFITEFTHEIDTTNDLKILEAIYG
jgi:CMP-N,N'-diacetyllegionaminic acid synthase